MRRPRRHRQRRGIAWRRAGDLLYGVLELDEAAFAGDATRPPLQRPAPETYRRIFRLPSTRRACRSCGAWNYLADINVVTHGLERYRQFNIGRRTPFSTIRGATGNVPPPAPSASPVGRCRSPSWPGDACAGGGEPRQVSAYLYPVDYGPRSPFSRAALALLPGQEILFIPEPPASSDSHGASGDAGGAMPRDARQHPPSSPPITVKPLGAVRSGGTWRTVYRHAADFPAIPRRWRNCWAPPTSSMSQADICRADLLLEIEAHLCLRKPGNC